MNQNIQKTNNPNNQDLDPESLLSKISIFKSFNPEERSSLFEIGSQKSFKAKAHIIIEGEESRGLYVVLAGVVSVHKNDPTSGSLMRLAMLEAGAHFGEFSLFDRTPRSATVVAETDCIMFELDVESFEFFLQRFGQELQVRFYKTCAELLANRFRRLNDDYIHAQQLLWKYALRK